jgi:3'-phosphoadenosine 5'-phosphosulfate sulfotransferase (PAPS reductase)/FAD synthetase
MERGKMSFGLVGELPKRSGRELWIERLYALKLKQALPLEEKVELSRARIKDWYEYWHGNVAVSFSGGKDSTVLLDLVRGEYPEAEAIFVNTGLEYPEIVSFVKTINNVTILRPLKNFRQVIEDCGWPLVSKQIAADVHRLRVKKDREGIHNPAWRFLYDAPFKISDACCHSLKTGPLRKWTKGTGRMPITGTMAHESYRRKWTYVKAGKCNVTWGQNPRSNPMSFWTTQDVLRYLKDKKLPISSIYGDIVESYEGRLSTSKEQRTGCVFCCFGLHMEKGPNRFERLARTHPGLHDYVMNKLGLKEVLAWLRTNAPYNLRGKFKDGYDRQNTLF